MHKKEIKYDIRRWNDLTCSKMGKINSKSSHPTKPIYRFNIILFKISTHNFSPILKGQFLAGIWKNKITQNNQIDSEKV